ncbi:MAG: CBS domain-containing protein [Desulfovibrio sp.]|uniref:CBS domain-containing protein n=1 Tax=Desulfovibrio sp. 7SRBS1 TaxID=3378064 RepID=UPI003B3C740B
MLTVRQLMTLEPYSLHESDNVLSARTLMTGKRIRHIPILTDSGTFSGLVTHRDLLSHAISLLADIDEHTQTEIDSGIPVREIMRRDVLTIGPDIPVRDAAEILLENKYGCLPVLDSGKLVGILTEADFLKLTISLIDELEKKKSH